MGLVDTKLWYAQGGALVRRGVGAAFSLGTTLPTSANTGYTVLGFAANTLTDYYGDYTFTTNGQTTSGLRIHGAVYMPGSNQTLQGCEVVGRVPAGYPTSGYNANYRGLVTSTGTNNLVQYCHLTQYDTSTNTDNSISYREGIYLTSGSLTVSRCDIHDVNHIMYITGGTLKAYGNYLHHPGFRTDDTDHSSDATHPNWSHNDGIHLAGGSAHDIQGNHYLMRFSTLTGMNSTANPNPNAEQIWPNCHGNLFRQANSTLPGVILKNNWYEYGSICHMFTTSQLTGGGGDWTISGNRYTPNQSKEFNVYRQIEIDASQWSSSLPSLIGNSNVYSNMSDTPSGVVGLPLNGNPSGNPINSGGTIAWAYSLNSHTGAIP